MIMIVKTPGLTPLSFLDFSFVTHLTWPSHVTCDMFVLIFYCVFNGYKLQLFYLSIYVDVFLCKLH